jgi:hypothetical protein
MMKTMKSKLEKLVILEGLKSDNASSEYDAEFSEYDARSRMQS